MSIFKPILVDLATAKNHLRILDNNSDSDVVAKLEMASAAIMDFLKLEAFPDAWLEPDTSPPIAEVPPHIQAATLVTLSDLYENREATVSVMLSAGVKDLLRRARDPALA